MVRVAVYAAARRLGFPKLIVLGLIAAFALYAIGGARAAETLVVKAGDVSRTNNTLAVDNELTFTATSGVTYDVTATLIYGSPAGAGTPDMRIGFGEDLVTRSTLTGAGVSTTNTPGLVGGAANIQANWQAGTETTDRTYTLSGSYLGGGGTAGVYWAQNTTGANATILRAGSTLRVKPSAEAEGGGGGGGSTAWGDITDKPTFNLSWLDDVDTTGAIDGVVLKYDEAATEWQVATDNAGGEGSSGPVTLSAGDRERLDLAWWGVWALVGLALLALIAPAMYRLLDVRHGMGGRFERG